MGTWTLDTKGRPGVFAMRLEGNFSPAEMRDFVAQHNAGVDSYGRQPYRVFVDIRALQPLSPECTALMEKAKQHSASRPAQSQDDSNDRGAVTGRRELRR